MADPTLPNPNPGAPPPAGDPKGSGPDAGFAFRAEMTAVDTFLRYWPHAIGLVVLGLVGFLAWGRWREYHADQQEVAAAKIAETRDALRADLDGEVEPAIQPLLEKAHWRMDALVDLVGRLPPEQRMQLIIGSPVSGRTLGQFMFDDNLASLWVATHDELDTALLFVVVDDEARAKLVATGDQLVAIGTNAGGGEGARACLGAAELFRRADHAEKRRDALAKASSFGTDLLRLVAETNLATMDADAGQPENAIKRYDVLVAGLDDDLAQQAMISKAQLYLDLNRPDDARATYDQFLVRWPTGKVADRVRELQTEVPATATAAAPTPAPEPTPEAPPEPAPGGQDDGSPDENGG